MNPEDRNEARQSAYRLLADLFRDGPRPDTRRDLAALPELAAALPDPFDADEAAAAHFELFHLEVFPLASVFLDPDGRPGGAVTEEAHAWRRHLGALDEAAGAPADHLVAELGVLADASDDVPIPELRRFLVEHLLAWLLPLACALKRVAAPFYAGLGGLTLDLALDHLDALGPGPVTGRRLAPLPDLLGDPATGIRDIATVLARPAQSGLWISRADLRRLGRGLRLPAGFGSRVDLLATLFRSAAAYEAPVTLLEELRRLVDGDARFYEEIASEYPQAAVVAAIWQGRLKETRILLGGIQDRLQAGTLT